MTPSPSVGYLARHANQLQGLRTALLGTLFILCAAWNALRVLWEPAVSILPASLFPIIIACAWYFDDQLSHYYLRRVGLVRPLHPVRRLVTLAVIGTSCLWLIPLDSWATVPVSVTALLLAGVQLHIGGISGAPHRTHYLFSGAFWCVVSFMPLLELKPQVAETLWLVAIGATLTVVGWCDHVVLIRSLLTTEGDTDD